jgi:hypothetical protein
VADSCGKIASASQRDQRETNNHAAIFHRKDRKTPLLNMT